MCAKFVHMFQRKEERRLKEGLHKRRRMGKGVSHHTIEKDVQQRTGPRLSVKYLDRGGVPPSVNLDLRPKDTCVPAPLRT